MLELYKIQMIHLSRLGVMPAPVWLRSLACPNEPPAGFHNASVLADFCPKTCSSEFSFARPGPWWLVSEGGSLALRSSTFLHSSVSDPCEMEYAALARNGACNVPKQCSAGDWDDCGAPQAASEGAGKLLNVLSASVDVLIRNCTALNLTLQSQATLGVVDSVFDPPLDTASMRTVSPPSCGIRVAGEELCDPRANCTLAASGGVHCACVGGLRYKPGAPEDGTQCQQDTFIDMQVLSKLANTRVRKPSNNTGAPSMTIDVRAFGEQPFEAPYQVTLTLIRLTWTSCSATNRRT
jgi:hypothetical protein